MLCTLLVNACKERQHLLPPVVTALCGLQLALSSHSVAALKASQLGNAQQALKGALLSLFKLDGVGGSSRLAEGSTMEDDLLQVRNRRGMWRGVGCGEAWGVASMERGK